MEKLGQAANVAQLLGVDLKGLTSMFVWAVKTICRNGNECRQLAERADRLAVVLPKLQESEMGGRLEEEWKLLEEGAKDTLRRAYDLVEACQQGHGFSNHLRRFRLRNDLADRRRKVDDYLQQLRLFNQRITTDEQTRLLHDIRDRVVNQDGAQVSQELITNHSDCNASDAMAYTLLKYVTQDGHNWTVLVRLARLWEHADHADKSNVLRLDFVMVDKEGTAMQGTVPKYLLPQFAPLLKEGSVYYLSYFEVTDAKEKYRAVDAVLMARLTRFSIVQEVTPQPKNLPAYVYTATPFTTLQDRIGETGFLTDVVGVLKSVSAVTQKNTRHGTTAKRDISLSDGSKQIAACLWGSHAEAFNIDGTHLTSNEGPTIILFVGMIVTSQYGRLTLQSKSATKWYINVLIPEVRSLRVSVGTQPHRLQWQENPVDRPHPIEASLTELVHVNPNDAISQGTHYKFDIFIKGFMPNQHWWFLGCSSCWTKTIPDGDGYKCPKCHVRTAEPRYRIIVQAIDHASINMPNAPVAKFLFFSDVSQNLVGRPAALLVAAAGGQSTYIPPELKDLIGRRYTVIAEMSLSSPRDEYLTFRVRAVEQHDANLVISTHPSVAEAPTSVINASLSAPAEGGIGAETTPTPALLPNSELASLTPSTSTLPDTEELGVVAPINVFNNQIPVCIPNTDSSSSKEDVPASSIRPSKRLKATPDPLPALQDKD